MDKTIAGLIGAVGVLASADMAQAAVRAPQSVAAALQAHSYADLLAPIPNAAALSMQLRETQEKAPIEDVQLVILHHHHHHHHHRYYRHRYYRHRYHHHHHHHY